MSEKDHSELFESLSAVADGEANEFELRRILKEDDSQELLNKQWSQYQLIGAALRREPSQGADISSAVSSAIAEESQPSAISRFFKPASQVAVAASVAVIALFGVQQYQLTQVDTGASNGQVAEVETLLNDSQVTDYLPPVGFEVRPQTTVVSTGPQTQAVSNDVSVQVPFDQSLFEQHLEESILKHSENAVEASQDIYPMLRAPIDSD